MLRACSPAPAAGCLNVLLLGMVPAAGRWSCRSGRGRRSFSAPDRRPATAVPPELASGRANVSIARSRAHQDRHRIKPTRCQTLSRGLLPWCVCQPCAPLPSPMATACPSWKWAPGNPIRVSRGNPGPHHDLHGLALSENLLMIEISKARELGLLWDHPRPTEACPDGTIHNHFFSHLFGKSAKRLSSLPSVFLYHQSLCYLIYLFTILGPVLPVPFLLRLAAFTCDRANGGLKLAVGILS